MNRGVRCFVIGISMAACGSPTATSVPPPAPAPAVAPTVSVTMDPPAPPPLAPVAEDPPRQRPPLPAVAPCRSAVVLVLDRSGSMTGDPIEMAKDAMMGTLKSLDQRDCYGVITFDSSATRWIPLGPLKDREALKKRIGQITAGGGTDLRAALDAGAREILSAETASRRGLVLMTDGQSPSDGLKELAASLARERIVISTIGIGGGVDESVMRMIAAEGSGRSLKVNDVHKLPAVLSGEVARIVTP